MNMPLYALVYTEVVCPKCKALIRSDSDDPVQIQWGAIPETYFIGQAVRWISRSTWLKEYPSHDYFNRGDARVSHVIVLDESIVWHCQHCTYIPGGVGVEVSNGVLIRSVVFSNEQLSSMYAELPEGSETDVIVVSTDGEMRCMERVPCDID
jgi:hypothetical protein